MLGRHHLAISVLVVIPFIIPLIFLNDINLTIPIAFLVAVVVGSLTPDADCGGNSKLYYDFYVIDWLMKKLITPLVLVSFKIISNKKPLEYDVVDEHRGIMHSPSGIIISSFLLAIIFAIAVIILNTFNFLTALMIFLGLLIGQLLHLMEDSMTVSGINWGFPFKEKISKGKIYTFPKIDGKKDIRPGIFVYSLGIFSFILFFILALKIIEISLWLIYLLILICVSLIITINISIAKSERNFWYKDKEKLRQMKRKQRAFLRNFGS